jgi:hypothetical protein
MFRKFKNFRFGAEAQQRIDQANEIIEDYLEQGYKLTLRQLYYQFVSRDLIPNTERSYKNLGNVISKGRLAGLIDWDALEDRMRQPKSAISFPSIDELVRAAVRGFRLPRRKGQEEYVELWVEKDALAGVLEPIARKHHITLMVNRGYSSSSAMFDAAQRISENMVENGSERATILYLGDLDPSGEDMVRDIQDRLDLFGTYVDVKKIALTIHQVDEHRPPPNPTKLTDSRAKDFIARYGMESWEVDALNPGTLTKLIETWIEELTDQSLVDAILKEEKVQKDRIMKVLK